MKTALVGNGLSIAYNPQLACPTLATHLSKQLVALGTATEVASTLSNLAAHFDASADGDLESLLGPLDLLGGAVGYLADLASLTEPAPQSIMDAIQRVGDFARAVYRTGTAHVLDAIASRSQGAGDYKIIDLFASEIAESSDRVTIATLNYDGLLHSGLINTRTIADLAAGYDQADFAVVPRSSLLRGSRLRHHDDLPCEFKLVNLHGSLGWLERNGEFAKFSIPDLRSQSYWEAWRKGSSDWSPVVVLTNQQAKSRRVLEYPFHLACSIFEADLRASTHWLIAGYGLGDKPVNAAVARAAAAIDWRLVECLVVTGRDSGLTPAGVAATLGIRADRIKLCAHGFPEAIDCAHWHDWKAA